MSGVQLAHVSDIHFGPDALAEVRKCAASVVDRLSRAERVDAIVLSGDLFDHRMEAHTPAFREALRWVRSLAEVAPVLVLQGTFSHDVPGMLDVLRLIDSHFPIAIADEEGAYVLSGGRWAAGAEGVHREDTLVVYAWPPLPRADFATQVDSPDTYAAYVTGVHARAAAIADSARAAGVPSVFTSHGTVAGCVTEHGQVLVSPDHEFGTAELFALGYDAVALGHIHKQQVWREGGQCIAYAGSIARLCAGDYDPKGWLLWSLEPGHAVCENVATPARDMIELTFDGVPDMARLQEVADNCAGAIVRVRYSVEPEAASLVDRQAITAMFATAELCRVEANIKPRLVARVPQIATARGLQEKLELWRNSQPQPGDGVALQRALSTLIDVPDTEVLVDAILNSINAAVTGALTQKEMESDETHTPDPVRV